MNLRRLLLASMLLLLPAALVPPQTGAQAPTVVKLATLVPEGSVWDKILKELGSQWIRETGGRVSLRIYPGGVAGDEPDIVRKMRIGQLQSAALTVAGLGTIDDAFLVFGIPMFFDSYEELLYVLDKLEPVLKKRLEAKGMVLLNWGHAGWVHFFTRQPVQTVDDLKKIKIFVWAGDDRMVQMWKDNGFQPVALAATDILSGLQTGMIDGLPTTPLAALSLQWFRVTPYMAETGLAPLVGGLIITRAAWSKISAADQVRMLEACQRAEERLVREIPEQDRVAVTEMLKRGMRMSKVKPESVAQWRATADQFARRMRGTMVPPEVLDLALRERAAFRQRRTGGSR